MTLVTAKAMLKEPIGADLDEARHHERHQRISPDQKCKRPPRGRHEPAIDDNQRANELSCLARDDELPARQGTLPNRPLIAGQIDRHVARDEELEKDQRLHSGMRQCHIIADNPVQSEAFENAVATKDRGNGQHPRHIPFDRARCEWGVVVSDHHDGQIVEERQQHHHDRGDRIEIEDQDAGRHEQQEAHGLCDAIDRIAVHALENAAGLLDGRGDHRKPRRGQHTAAARAASVAPLTAMPTSACFSAGASFTPSPVMPTM